MFLKPYKIIDYNYNKNLKSFNKFFKFSMFMGKKRKSLRYYCRNYLRLHFIIIKTLYYTNFNYSTIYQISKKSITNFGSFSVTIYTILFFYKYKNYKKILKPLLSQNKNFNFG